MKIRSRVAGIAISLLPGIESLACPVGARQVFDSRMGVDKGVMLVRERRPLEAVSFDHHPDSPADDMPFPFFDNSASIAAQVTL